MSDISVNQATADALIATPKIRANDAVSYYPQFFPMLFFSSFYLLSSPVRSEPRTTTKNKWMRFVTGKTHNAGIYCIRSNTV